MSHYVLFVITGITTVKGCFEGINRWKETIREMKRDKERINELEEEIVRLKRELRICGVYTDKTDIEIFNKK